MALRGALVDQARVVRRAGTGVKVEGTTQMAELDKPWFRARLFMQESRERNEQGERKKVVVTPQLMFLATDVNGDATDVLASDELDVQSAELGDFRWRVLSDPQPMRKKRRVIGWLTTLERVKEPARATV